MVGMTTANILTICRLVMIPCFAIAVAYYSAGFQEGQPDERLRWLAVTFFAIAAITDGVDGYVARRFNQRTRLGAILDPLADKALVMTALLFLSWNPGRAFDQLPLWLPIIALSRDVLVVFGVALVWIMSREPEIKPHWIGKTASVLQMAILAFVLMKAPVVYWQAPLWMAGICTVISGAIYIVQGTRLLGAQTGG